MGPKKNKYSEVERQVMQRTIILNGVTRFEVYLENYNALSPPNVSELKCRIKKFEGLWDEFNNLQTEIEISSPDLHLEETNRESFENNYFRLLAAAEGLISQPNKPSEATNSLDDCAIKFQPISIPKFSGAYEDWMSFSDAFQSMVHKNDKMSDVKKFHCLRSCLTGTAEGVIKNIEVTSQNYKGAWELLEKRFYNKKIITFRHVKALFDYPKLINESAKELRNLLDNLQRHLQALTTLDLPVDTWDVPLIYLFTSKFDSETFKAWQEHSPHGQLPTLEELTDFMNQRCQILESLPSQNPPHNNPNSKSSLKSNQPSSTSNKTIVKSKQVNEDNACFHTQQHAACVLCKRPHPIFRCSRFLNLSIEDRIRHIEGSKIKMCKKCLNFNDHELDDCKFSNCPFCDLPHNSLLHTNIEHDSKPATLNQTSKDSTTVTHSVDCLADATCSKVILSTALVYIQNANGTQTSCRVLLDCGSQSNFITESACKYLGLNCSKTKVPISGINSTSTHVSHSTKAIIRSLSSEFSCTVDFLVIPNITGNIPSSSLNIDSWEIPTYIPLADPTWNFPAGVDALIGARHFWDLLLDSKVSIPNSSAILRETKLGYIFCGSKEASSNEDSGLCHLSTLDDLDLSIQAFWRVDEWPINQQAHTGEDKTCELHYNKTVTRQADGRYIVQIPLRSDPSCLGDSRKGALRRFHSLEAKLSRNLPLYNEYRKFMNEYLMLGHMEECSKEQDEIEYFIPHHAVRKDSSTTTKLRVVFDASFKSDQNISLNDIQMVGPNIQDSLFSILIRFRMYNFVILADIEKMYRQTLIDPSQTSLQKIFWRNSPSEELKVFKLVTVTYGTASAPYLAIRSLHQVFVDEGPNFPHAVQSEQDFYVDNYMSGCNTVEEGFLVQRDLIALLNSGRLHLRKWSSNCSELLRDIPDDDKEKLDVVDLDGEITGTVKSLGLLFNPDNDSFSYSVQLSEREPITKRAVLSEIAQIFDPMGVIGPVILKAKIFMQHLWRLGLGWDEPLPDALQSSWHSFRDSLASLAHFKIARQVTIDPQEDILEIHAFSDASESAYGACVYFKNVSYLGNVKGISLLCSKSRVAPLKCTTLPRLELCGALLMVQLVDTISQALSFPRDRTYYWTDSTVVLAWINATSSNWATFVANRVSKIQEHSDPKQWRHVSGDCNPADLISRGSHADQLIKSNLWWQGPDFLQDPTVENPWSMEECDNTLALQELRRSTVSLVATTTEWDLLFKFSSFLKLKRVLAYCRRFLHNSRIRKESKDLRRIGALSTQELNDSEVVILRLVQINAYPDEYSRLTTGRKLSVSSKLLTLDPFICDQGLIRVGGRVTNAIISTDRKHPIILPPRNYISRLIAHQIHIQQLHCGPQALLASLRLRYWPINGRHLTKQVLKNCVTCFRVRPNSTEQLMGQLPKARVQPSRPFTHCGIDYCGPIQIRLNKLRKPVIGKAWVSIFVCFATKAIHIEMVEDLSTESFIAALRRFTARRGKPSAIYSDNSTTFTGASNQLKSFLRLDETQDALTSYTTSMGIQWNFIPPYSPSMGGLWEASVKLVKHHLRRTMGVQVLTFANLYTLLVEIEACVNSRPLFPLSSDPSDLAVLTPAHFLVGDSLAAPPDADLHLLPVNRLNEWQRVQKLAQHFWNRWSREYLVELQHRNKWRTREADLQIGAMVVIKDDQAPPLKWKLGRVIELHPGSDGRVRVATMRTSTGTTKRVISQICPLPLQEAEESMAAPDG